MGGARIRFTQAARTHRVGRASARHVMAGVVLTNTSTHRGSPAWFYVGSDERGRELEIIATEVVAPTGKEILLVVHVMPTALRGRTRDA